MKSTDKTSILKSITPDVVGIFWMTNQALNTELKFYTEFNYLFDGLLSDYIQNSPETINQNCLVFHTKNFNHKIWLLHLHGNNFSSQIDEQIAILNSNNISEQKILLINETEKKWEDELPKRYPNFKFIILN